jgi:threonine dehydratase
VRFAFRELKLVVEPGGAVSLAAILAGKLDFKGRTVAAILTGGNIDAALFADIIQDRRRAA